LQEHANGNRGWNFTLEIETQSGAIQLDVVEAASAILPSATYLVHDRPSRQVGYLGDFHLVSASARIFVSLNVNSYTGQFRRFVK
jgi:hypothetical protein